MEALISSILITAAVLALTGAVLTSLYHIPVRIRLGAVFSSQHPSITGGAGWGIFSGTVSWEAGGWVMRFRVGTTPLYTTRGGPGRKEPAEPGPSDEEEISPCRPPFQTIVPLIPRLIAIALSHLCIGRIDTDIVFGAGDPATTGMVYGWYHAVRPLITRNGSSILVEPDFTRQLLEGEAEGVMLITRPAGLAIRSARIFLPLLIPGIIHPPAGAGRSRAGAV